MDALGGDGGMGVPDMAGGAPPMGGDPMMGDPNAMGMDPNMGGEDMEGFDPGVDADPEQDPKKYLQQLAGKLSQELNKYTTDNGADPDLAKYIIGMVDTQAVKSLTDSDKQEVIKKIEKGEQPDENGSEGLGESLISKQLFETQLKEIINNILHPDDYSKDREEREIRNPYLNKKRSPFVANR